MLNSSVSRTYCAKNLTLDTFIDTRKLNDSITDESNESNLNNTTVKIYPYQKTRVDYKVNTYYFNKLKFNFANNLKILGPKT